MDIDVVVETPQGSRQQVHSRPEERAHPAGPDAVHLDRLPARLRLCRWHPRGGRRALDVLVWLDEPTFPGCLVTVRPVAVFWMDDERGPDAKVLGVCSHDPRKAAIRDLGDVPATCSTRSATSSTSTRSSSRASPPTSAAGWTGPRPSGSSEEATSARCRSSAWTPPMIPDRIL